MTKSHIDVCGTPSIMHLSSGATGSTAVHPNVRSSHPQNFLHMIAYELNVYVFQFLRTSQVAADEDLSVDRVFSHVELHDIGD